MPTPIRIIELEQAINFWRARRPSQGEERRLCEQAAALAEPYAMMIFHHRGEIALEELAEPARAAYAEWQAQRGQGG